MWKSLSITFKLHKGSMKEFHTWGLLLLMCHDIVDLWFDLLVNIHLNIVFHHKSVTGSLQKIGVAWIKFTLENLDPIEFPHWKYIYIYCVKTFLFFVFCFFIYWIKLIQNKYIGPHWLSLYGQNNRLQRVIQVWNDIRRGISYWGQIFQRWTRPLKWVTITVIWKFPFLPLLWNNIFLSITWHGFWRTVISTVVWLFMETLWLWRQWAAVKLFSLSTPTYRLSHALY